MKTFDSSWLRPSRVADAQGPADLVMLPAPAASWRMVAAHQQSQLELTGDSVVVPQPGAQRGPSSHLHVSVLSNCGLRESVLFDWDDPWQATLRIESREPLDLRPYLGGALEFDLDVAELDKGGLQVRLGRGGPIDRGVNLMDMARAMAGKGWQRVTLALSCFLRDGVDLAEVMLPFSLEGAGSGRVSVSNIRITSRGAPCAACPDYRTESVTPAVLNESWSVDWWLPRHRQKLEEKRQLLAAGTSPEIVFIGDSITQGWELEGLETWQRHYASHHALNLGFSGDRTENVLWRLQHGEVDGLSPKVVVLKIGTNNAGYRAENPQTTAAGIQCVLDEIRERMPAAKVLLLAIFPRGEKPGDFLRGINERVNQLIAPCADGRDIHFLDIGAALLDADGTLSTDVMPDLLHLAPKGYAIWQREMDATLQRLLRQA